MARINVVAIRHSITNGIDEAGGDLNRWLTRDGIYLAQKARANLGSKLLYPKASLITMARRTSETATIMHGPLDEQFIVSESYPGEPELTGDALAALEVGYGAACEEAQSSNISWRQLADATEGTYAAEWLATYRWKLVALLSEKARLHNTILVVGHGPTPFSALEPETHDMAAKACSGAILTIEISENEFSVLDWEPFEPSLD
jgi:phosphohistidine phosphatase SixA